MLVIETSSLLRQHILWVRRESKRIALVPTMGNLHDGHMQLVDKAKTLADIVIVSIFVNMMQFDCIDDLIHYPRTLKKDYEKLNEHHVDFVFTPSQIEMYPEGVEKTTYVDVPGISTMLEGASRPRHFRGVSTIVSKFFNLIQPDFACFGEKDYQQLMMIRKMVVDMNYHIDIVSIPIIRAKDGLALSSRNSYLTTEQRKIAPYLSKIMNTIAENFSNSRLSMKKIITVAKQELNERGFYASDVQIRDADTLHKLTAGSKHAVILIAAKLGTARLIDNKVVALRKR